MLDKTTKTITKALQDIMTINNLFGQYKVVTTINKSMVKATNWYETKWSLTYNSIINMKTSKEERLFKIKIFMEELPMKKNLVHKYLNILKDFLCLCCNKLQYTLLLVAPSSQLFEKN